MCAGQDARTPAAPETDAELGGGYRTLRIRYCTYAVGFVVDLLRLCSSM